MNSLILIEKLKNIGSDMYIEMIISEFITYSLNLNSRIYV